MRAASGGQSTSELDSPGTSAPPWRSAALRVTRPVFINNLLRPGPGPRDRLLFAFDGQAPSPAALRLEGVGFHGGERVVRARVIGGETALVRDRVYQFVLAGPGAVTVFDSTCLVEDDGSVIARFPGEVRQTGFRCSPRAGTEGAATVSIDGPGGARARLVVDVSARGLAFAVEDRPRAPGVGDRLALSIALAGVVVRAEGIVRAVADRPGGPLSCGVELVSFRGDGAQAWRRFVFGRLHPHLRDGAVDDAWQALERSGYLRLWAPGTGRDHLRRQFVEAWGQPHQEVGDSVVLHDERGPVGVTAASLLYPGTWLLHHLGVDPRSQAQASLDAAAELMGGVLFRLATGPALEHFVIYVEADKRWNALVYGDFVARYFAPDQIAYVPVRLHRWQEGAREPQGEPEGVTVTDAEPALWAILAEALRTRPAIERRAFALDHRIDLGGFGDACAARGYERRRHGLFAMRGGRPVAALLAETGGEGVNVFGLLNTARFVPLGPPDPAAKAALVDAGVARFRAAGKRTFLLIEDGDGDADGVAERCGLAPLPAGMCWIAHRDVIPAWTAYLDGLLRSPAPRAVEAPAKRAANHTPVPEITREQYQTLRAGLDFHPAIAPALAILAFDGGLLLGAAALLRRGTLGSYLLSQLLLAVLFFNAFSILHECGHASFSRSRLVNTIVGHLASTFCFIPYFPWKLIHHEHHLWTGNLDRDPVLGSLRRFRDRGVPPLVRFSWRSWIPLAALLQHLVYLGYPLARARAGTLGRGQAARTALSVLWSLGSLAGLHLLAPELVRPSRFLLGLVLFLTAEELVNLPHHLGMPTVTGKLAPWQQHRATRSCYYPRGLSELLVLNFNFHVEHHMFPGLPWYRLRRARALLWAAVAAPYQEHAGISWNLQHRTRGFDTLVAGYRTRGGGQ